MRFLGLFLLFSVNTFSNETYEIADKLRAGNTLIYDCKLMAYICVNDISKENCKDQLELAIKKKSEKLPCAILKTFTKKEDCLHQNYQVIQANSIRKFCHLN